MNNGARHPLLYMLQARIPRSTVTGEFDRGSISAGSLRYRISKEDPVTGQSAVIIGMVQPEELFDLDAFADFLAPFLEERLQKLLTKQGQSE